MSASPGHRKQVHWSKWIMLPKEFREMKMQPSLERALRHKEILGA